MATLKSNQCTTYICTLTGTNPEEEYSGDTGDARVPVTFISVVLICSGLL